MTIPSKGIILPTMFLISIFNIYFLFGRKINITQSEKKSIAAFSIPYIVSISFILTTAILVIPASHYLSDFFVLCYFYVAFGLVITGEIIYKTKSIR